MVEAIALYDLKWINKMVSLQLEAHLCITPAFQEAFVSVPDTFNNAVYETVKFFLKTTPTLPHMLTKSQKHKHMLIDLSAKESSYILIIKT